MICSARIVRPESDSGEDKSTSGSPSRRGKAGQSTTTLSRIIPRESASFRINAKDAMAVTSWWNDLSPSKVGESVACPPICHPARSEADLIYIPRVCALCGLPISTAHRGERRRPRGNRRCESRIVFPRPRVFWLQADKDCLPVNLSWRQCAREGPSGVPQARGKLPAESLHDRP